MSPKNLWFPEVFKLNAFEDVDSVGGERISRRKMKGAKLGVFREKEAKTASQDSPGLKKYSKGMV
jgi:hypothetical protein